MNAARESVWQALLARALAILDDAIAHGMPDDWSFGVPAIEAERI